MSLGGRGGEGRKGGEEDEGGEGRMRLGEGRLGRWGKGG